MDIPLPADVEELLSESFTPVQINFLILLNPMIILIIAVLVGTLLFDRVNLRVPIIEKLVGIEKKTVNILSIVSSGIVGGIVAGIIVVLVIKIFKPLMIDEYQELTKSVKPSLAARFLYGGITEEIYLRFGLMTLLVWIGSKLTKRTKSYSLLDWNHSVGITFCSWKFPGCFQFNRRAQQGFAFLCTD